MYIRQSVSISVASLLRLVSPENSKAFPRPVRDISRVKKNDGNIYSRRAPSLLPSPRSRRPFFYGPAINAARAASLSHSSRYICLLVLNRPVITALKGRYSGRWLRTFYSALFAFALRCLDCVVARNYRSSRANAGRRKTHTPRIVPARSAGRMTSYLFFTGSTRVKRASTHATCLIRPRVGRAASDEALTEDLTARDVERISS